METSADTQRENAVADAIEIHSFPLGDYQTNCYVVVAKSELWIVDAGFDPAAMLDHVGAMGLAPKAILLTHAHADHIGGVQQVLELYPGTPVLLHPTEHGWLTDPVHNLSAHLGAAVVVDVDGGALPFENGMELTLGPSTWRVHHTPGHSPGGVTIHCPAAGVAFVGDTLFAGSIGRSDFPTSDHGALVASVRNTLYALPADTRVLPGHGPETTVGREKLANPYVRADGA